MRRIRRPEKNKEKRISKTNLKHAVKLAKAESMKARVQMKMTATMRKMKKNMRKKKNL